VTSDELELARLNRSLAAKLRNEALKRGVATEGIRKQYVFTLFLSRMFDVKPQPPWVLLGGNALLIRTGGGRFTQDIDLAKEGDWEGPEQLGAELQRMVDARSDRDPFVFTIESVHTQSEPDPYGYGGKTAKAKVVAKLGSSGFEAFSVDLTLRRHVDAPVDQVKLRPVIDHPTLAGLPSVPTTPLENHLADKLCAMYEGYGNGSSTRYRDLADIVRILHAGALDAERLLVVLDRETRRRQLTLPRAMTAPSETWRTAFPSQARTFAEYPPELYDLSASLDATRGCLDEILSGTRATGTWDCDGQTWVEVSPVE
jgi:predicted nucleotidyltransferase component of viral defense system